MVSALAKNHVTSRGLQELAVFLLFLLYFASFCFLSPLKQSLFIDCQYDQAKILLKIFHTTGCWLHSWWSIPNVCVAIHQFREESLGDQTLLLWAFCANKTVSLSIYITPDQKLHVVTKLIREICRVQWFMRVHCNCHCTRGEAKSLKWFGFL